ncbi:MAG: helix-hairpin-helix domain-containing protein [Pseudomonadota bacterium]|nr:helix-hairpin-helix domain-containing protein [Pseudomonadota bacterium]
MFKKFLTFLAALSVFAAFAAVDVNKASEAELDGIKGIGPATTRVIVAERQKTEFKNWEDFISRVKGIGPKSAAKFSAEGMTVGGAPYQGGAPVAVKKNEKTVAKADAATVAASAVKK